MTDTMEAIEVDISVVGTGRKVRPFSFTAPDTVWGDLIRFINEEGDTGVAKAIQKEIAASGYDGTFESDEPVTISPTEKNAPGVAAALNQMVGTEINLDEIEQPEKATSRSSGTPRAPKEPTFCMFSGEPTSGGRFLPGFDMKLRGGLTRIVDNTNMSDTDVAVVGTGTAATEYTVEGAIDKLVDLGWYTREDLEQRRERAFKKVADREEAKRQREAERAAAKAAKAQAESEESDEE